MRVLMRNTVFKTATLAGLFLCMLVFAGVFFRYYGFRARHPTAAEVGTDTAKLEQFVKAAIDEYYINTILKSCDFSQTYC